jgi:hypothetical protein
MRRIQLFLSVFAALASVFVGGLSAQDSSIVFTKTVGLDPTQCADASVLTEPPADGIVYYCYKMTYTGAISASCHTLEDSVLGDVLHNTPGGKCCADASGTNCSNQPTADKKCQVTDADPLCNDPMFPVCAEVTYPGVCCNDEEGIDCPIPLEGCDVDDDCAGASDCVTDPLVANGQMITRVITATVPAGGITNTATWTARTGICCTINDVSSCDGEDVNFCNDTSDCFGTDTCHKENVGLCCDPNDVNSCDSERVCLGERECDDPSLDPNSPFTECTPLDTVDQQEAVARVGVFDTPALSAAGLSLLVLGLAGIGLFHVRRRQNEV